MPPDSFLFKTKTFHFSTLFHDDKWLLVNRSNSPKRHNKQLNNCLTCVQTPRSAQEKSEKERRGVCTQANNYFDRAMCSRPTLLTGSLKIKVDYLRNLSRLVFSSGYYAPFSLNALSTPMDFHFHVPADCHQICTNTQGSYSCSCFSGYQLSSDGKSCLGESLGKTLVVVRAVSCRSIVFYANTPGSYSR